MKLTQMAVEGWFESFGTAIVKFRWPVLATLMLLFGGLAAQLPTLTSDNSVESFFAPDDPQMVAYDAMREQFGRDSNVFVLVGPSEVFSIPFLEKLREFHEALEDETPYLRDVTSLINVRETRGEGDELVVED